MKLKNKIILVVVIILALSGAVIMGIWYQTSSKLTSTYLQNVSESSMKDAYHAFEYLLRHIIHGNHDFRKSKECYTAGKYTEFRADKTK